MKQAVLAAAIMVWLALPGSAAPEPEISVAVVKDPVRTDTSQSHRRLRARMLCERPGAMTGHYLGLSQATVDTRFHVQAYARSTSEGLKGGLASVSIELRLKDRTVYVARELPEGSCAYRETLAHEKRHTAIDDAILENFKPRMEKAVREAAADLQGLRGDSRADLLAAIRRPLQAVLQRQMTALEREREQRHAAFDTGKGKTRPAKSCDVSAQHYLEKADRENGTWHTPVDCGANTSRPQGS